MRHELREERWEFAEKVVFLLVLNNRNQLLYHTDYDPESLTKQSDADLHNMQEQTFAGIFFFVRVHCSSGTSVRRYQ